MTAIVFLLIFLGLGHLYLANEYRTTKNSLIDLYIAMDQDSHMVSKITNCHRKMLTSYVFGVSCIVMGVSVNPGGSNIIFMTVSTICISAMVWAAFLWKPKWNPEEVE
jgi:hypothetical protein